ncbi:MAG: sulfatase-like hydrolase/transferase [Thermoflexaceae bacterium]|nr:sulfatase-like hydrolase/transferase [Thermoflexaceae bacterium]
MEKLKSLLEKRDKNILIPGIFLAIALNFLFFLYAPLEMYFINKVDMLFGMIQVLKVVCPLFLMGFLLAGLTLFVLWIIGERVYILGVGVLLLSYLCTYIQGTFLLKDLPYMDGRRFGWNEYIGGRIKSVILWIVMTGIIIMLFRILKKQKFLTFVKILCICMTLMLFITGAVLCITTKSYHSEEIIATHDKEFEMSSDKNFIILVLDSVNSKTTAKLFAEHPEYKEIFTDFTYYQNMIGAYGETQTAVPFILSGDWYENDENFSEYRENAYENSPLFHKLEQLNYTMGLYTEEVPHEKIMMERFNNIVDLDRTVTSFAGAADCMIKLAGFRYGFFDLKRYFTFNLYDCYNYFTPVGHTPYMLSNERFYDYVKEKEIEITEEKCFKYIHIYGAHIPWVFDENLNNIKESDYETMVKASFTLADAYLEKLKDAGVYDNSVIVIMADHGYNTVEEGNDWDHHVPFFCVKGYNEKHDFKISDAPVSYEDLQTAFSRLLDDYSSEDIFDYKEGDERWRRYLFNEFGYREHMIEYIHMGHAFDDTKFVPTGEEFDLE